MLLKISPTKSPRIYQLEAVQGGKTLLKKDIATSITFQQIGQIQNMVVRTMRQTNDRTLDIMTIDGRWSYHVQINISANTMTVEGSRSFYDIFSLHFQKAQKLESIYSPATSDENILEILKRSNETIETSAKDAEEPERPHTIPSDPSEPKREAPMLMGAQALEMVQRMRELRGQSTH